MIRKSSLPSIQTQPPALPVLFEGLVKETPADSSKSSIQKSINSNESFELMNKRKHFLRTQSRDSADEIMKQLQVIRTFKRAAGGSPFNRSTSRSMPPRRISDTTAYVSRARATSVFPEEMGYRFQSFATDYNRFLVSLNKVSEKLMNGSNCEVSSITEEEEKSVRLFL